MYDTDEWSIDNESFNIISYTYGPFSVDRFRIIWAKMIISLTQNIFMREHPILIHFQMVWVEIITGFALRYCVLVLCWGIWFNVKQEGITHTFLVVFVLLAWTIVWNNILWQNRFIMPKSTNLCLMRIFHKICWNKSDVPNMMIHDQ